MKWEILKITFVIIFFFMCSDVFAKISDTFSSLISQNLVLIKSGNFLMGSPETEMWRESDEHLHKVTLNNFYICKYEVTQKEYKSIMGKNPSHFKGNDLPVDSVSWYDAVMFCNKLSKKEHLAPAYTIKGENVNWNRKADGYRLPTEAEWEYACRAGTATPFNTGNNISPEQANYYGTYPYTIEDHYFSQDELETAPGVYRQKTLPVNSFKPNQWGLYNMHGNVSEWCYDLYGNYDTGSVINPEGSQSGMLRVCRGGGWNDFGKHLRSAYRAATPPNDCFFSRGFRVVRNAE